MTLFHTIQIRGLNTVAGSVLLLTAVSGAMAQSRLNTGAELTLQARYSYDSNLFLTPDELDDEYATYAARLAAGARYGLATLGFGGLVEDKRYRTYTDQDDTGYDLMANASIGDSAFRVSASGQMAHTIAPLDTTDTTRVESDTDRAWAKIEGTPFYLFGITLEGSYKDRRYTDINFDQYEFLRTDASVSIFGMYDNRTKVGLKYYKGEHDYDDDIRFDSEFTRMTAFTEYDRASEVSVKLELGYETFKFIGPSSMSANADTTEGAYAAASMKYMPNETWELEGEYNRNIELSYSPDSRFNIRQKVEFSATYRPILRVRFEANAYFTHTNEDTTYDNTMAGGGLKVAYALTKWSEVEVEYGYDEQHSEATDSNFTRHLVSIGLAIKW